VRKFSTFFDPTCIRFKNGATNPKSKTALMSGLSSATDPIQLWPLTLRSICPTGAPKARQLEKRLHRSNSAARGQIAFIFYKMVLRGSVKEGQL